MNRLLIIAMLIAIPISAFAYDAEDITRITLDANKGNAEAENKLGTIYFDGQAGMQNYAEAVEWFRKSADQGYAKAQFNLAQMYRQGKGIKQDNSEALKLYRMAAEQDYAPAQTNLGMIYYEGRGVAKDEGRAMVWWKKAADQGYAPAQVKLGASYAADNNIVEAKEWLNKAADQGNEEAKQLLDTLQLKQESTTSTDDYMDRRPVCIKLTAFLANPSVIPNEKCLYSYLPGDFPLQAMQITDGGILVDFPTLNGFAAYPGMGRLIFIYNDNKIENNLVDGSIIHPGYFSYEGKYQYIAVLGQEKTVYSFRRVMDRP